MKINSPAMLHHQHCSSLIPRQRWMSRQSAFNSHSHFRLSLS